VTLDASAAGRRLLDATADFFPRDVGDPRGLTQEELALAGLARARRLLWAMIELHTSGPDVAGMFARSIYETWVNVSFLLLEGDDALEVLSNNDMHAVWRVAHHLVEHVGRDDLAMGGNDLTASLVAQAEAVLAQGDAGRRRRLGTLDMAVRVSKWLEAHPDACPDPMFPLRAYASLFGPESYVGVHSGIGSMKQHLEPRKDAPERIEAGPWSSGNEEHRLLLCVAMVGSLARQVADRLGLPTDPLDVATRVLAEVSSAREEGARS
jgi:hypothetical protein